MHAEIREAAFIGKTVGRRRPVSALQVSPADIEASRQWRRAGFGIHVPKGVHKFRSHEEADEWLMKHLTRLPES